MASSAQPAPRDVYCQACTDRRKKANRDVVKMLPSGADAFSRIRELDLFKNFLGRNGLIPFVEVVKRCTNLVRLDLSDNYLSNERVVELCDALVPHPRLISLNFSRNPISYPAGKRLLKLISEKSLLCEVIVDHTLMNPGLALRITNAARENASRARADWASAARPPAAAEDISIFQAILESGDGQRDGLHALGSVHRETRIQDAVKASLEPTDDWYAMETIWNLAAAAAPRDDGWAGLASVMALVRQDMSLASMY